MTIEGIPEGWELVRFDYVNDGESYLGRHGDICLHACSKATQVKRLIIRKIEKPKQFRAFANAAEFKPHRDRWIIHKSNPDSCVRIDGCGNKGVTIQGNAHDFSRLFDERTFDDGTPFGIEVTE